MRQVEHHEHRAAAHHGRRIELALVDLRDPLNVGQAFRLGVSLGVAHLHLLGSTPGPPNAKLNRTARGAQSMLRYSCSSVSEGLAGFRQNRLYVVAIEYATDARDIRELAAELRQARRDTVLLVGNEAHGLPRDMLTACDAVGVLPMFGPVSSYNVATALALATWEFVRA